MHFSEFLLMHCWWLKIFQNSVVDGNGEEDKRVEKRKGEERKGEKRVI